MGNGRHVIVEVVVKNGNKTETLSLDAGVDCPSAMSNGNLGDGKTGVIDGTNRNPVDKNTNQPILTGPLIVPIPPPNKK